MKRNIQILIALLLILGCKPLVQSIPESRKSSVQTEKSNVIIAFGSCNKQDEANVFWDDILEANPDIFIWGGDNIYADTDDMEKMKSMYLAQNANKEYAKLKNQVFITGTWDDHDYGVNDGGAEFAKKKESQALFLDFMGVNPNDLRRNRDGIYSSQSISTPSGLIKIINLDTRYFRSSLTDGRNQGVRYQPNTYGEGTLLGAKQWLWLEQELNNSNALFTIIVSSIQFLSNEHGFEKWANHPHELQSMLDLIKKNRDQRIIFLSGDRHISEFSKMENSDFLFPLIDFTSSGLTHSYSSFSGEPNPYRIGEVISTKSFGLIELNLIEKRAHFKIMGEDGRVFQELKQAY